MTPCWLALAVDEADADKLQCLTTRVMAWGKGVWLLDLAPFLSYWQRQARASRQDVTGLWRDVLHHVFGGRRPGDKIVAMHVRFQAVLAGHPAAALLLLHHMKARRLTGFVTRSSEFGAQLFRQVNWESFWALAAELEEHWNRLKIRGWRGPLTSECERFKRAIARLGITHPDALRHIEPSSMNRRFGKRLGALWGWCWFPTNDTALQHFPWEDWQPAETLQVTRHLDHGVLSWQEVEPWLRLDFDRLAPLCAERRVTKLAWRLTLSDMETVTIPIGFRHPHRLQDEKDTQTTALLQAGYAFQAFELSQRQAVEEGAFPPYLVSWELSVTGLLSLPPILKDLFQDVRDSQSGEEGLLQLENELPIPLRRYGLCDDWLPEDSYQEGLETEPPAGAWRHAALRRPLFIYESPRPLAGKVHQALFSETVMTKWWREAVHGEGERHYFHLLSDKDETLWVYRNGKGEWWIHGVFA